MVGGRVGGLEWGNVYTGCMGRVRRGLGAVTKHGVESGACPNARVLQGTYGGRTRESLGEMGGWGMGVRVRGAGRCKNGMESGVRQKTLEFCRGRRGRVGDA